MGVLCLGTYEGGDAYDCEMRKGKFPIWELSKYVPVCCGKLVSCQFGNLPNVWKRIKGTFCPLDQKRKGSSCQNGNLKGAGPFIDAPKSANLALFTRIGMDGLRLTDRDRDRTVLYHNEQGTCKASSNSPEGGVPSGLLLGRTPIPR